MKTFFVVMSVVLCASAMAQISPEEAQKRLQEKHPTTINSDEKADLIRANKLLRDQIRDLKAENESLKDDVKKLTGEVALKHVKASDSAKITVGMTKDEAAELCKKRKWVYDVSSSSSAHQGKTVERETWVFRFAGQPDRIYIENGFVTRVEY